MTPRARELAAAAERLACRAGDPDAAVIGSVMRRLLQHERPAVVLGLKPAPGQRSPATLLRIAQRDAELRRIAAGLPGPKAARARAIATAWRRVPARPGARLPAGADPLKAGVFGLIRAGFAPLSESSVRRIIA